jgi:hypothetical protein
MSTAYRKVSCPSVAASAAPTDEDECVHPDTSLREACLAPPLRVGGEVSDPACPHLSQTMSDGSGIAGLPISATSKHRSSSGVTHVSDDVRLPAGSLTVTVRARVLRGRCRWESRDA